MKLALQESDLLDGVRLTKISLGVFILMNVFN